MVYGDAPSPSAVVVKTAEKSPVFGSIGAFKVTPFKVIETVPKGITVPALIWPERVVPVVP